MFNFFPRNISCQNESIPVINCTEEVGDTQRKIFTKYKTLSQKSGCWTFAPSAVQNAFLIIQVVLRIPLWDPRPMTFIDMLFPLPAHLAVESESLFGNWIRMCPANSSLNRDDRRQVMSYLETWILGQGPQTVKILEQPVPAHQFHEELCWKRFRISCPYESDAKCTSKRSQGGSFWKPALMEEDEKSSGSTNHNLFAFLALLDTSELFGSMKFGSRSTDSQDFGTSSACSPTPWRVML